MQIDRVQGAHHAMGRIGQEGGQTQPSVGEVQLGFHPAEVGALFNIESSSCNLPRLSKALPRLVLLLASAVLAQEMGHGLHVGLELLAPNVVACSADVHYLTIGQHLCHPFSGLRCDYAPQCRISGD